MVNTINKTLGLVLLLALALFLPATAFASGGTTGNPGGASGWGGGSILYYHAGHAKNQHGANTDWGEYQSKKASCI